MVLSNLCQLSVESSDIGALDRRTRRVVETSGNRDVPRYLLSVILWHVGDRNNDRAGGINDFLAAVLQVNHHVSIVSIDGADSTVVMMRGGAKMIAHGVGQTLDGAPILRVYIRGSLGGP